MDGAAWAVIGGIIGGIVTKVGSILLQAKKMDADAMGVLTTQHAAALNVVASEMKTAAGTFLSKLNDVEKAHLGCVEEKAGLKVENSMLRVQLDKLEKRTTSLEQVHSEKPDAKVGDH